MRGEIDPAVLTPFEAQTLLNQAQAFYLDAKRLEIVKTFNKVRRRYPPYLRPGRANDSLTFNMCL